MGWPEVNTLQLPTVLRFWPGHGAVTLPRVFSSQRKQTCFYPDLSRIGQSYNPLPDVLREVPAVWRRTDPMMLYRVRSVSDVRRTRAASETVNSPNYRPSSALHGFCSLSKVTVAPLRARRPEGRTGTHACGPRPPSRPPSSRPAAAAGCPETGSPCWVTLRGHTEQGRRRICAASTSSVAAVSWSHVTLQTVTWGESASSSVLSMLCISAPCWAGGRCSQFLSTVAPSLINNIYIFKY